jgi:hypothetical protein
MVSVLNGRRGVMAKRIKRVSDLPEWFNLKNYVDAESLSTAGWYEQFIVRRDLLSLIGSDRWHLWKIWKTNTPWTPQGNLTNALALIRTKPILDVTKNELLKAYFYGGALQELTNQHPRYSLGVHLSTVRNLYTAENAIEPEKREYARAFFASHFDSDWTKPLTHKHVDWIDEPINAISISDSFKVIASVNMLLPDNVLIEQFKNMLQEQRDATKATGLSIQNYRKPDFTNWINFGLLPYLDLQIWEREENVSIPNRVMADAIFLPGEGGEEVVRKTTEKLAKELLSLRNLETMAALAAYEITERNID